MRTDPNINLIERALSFVQQRIPGATLDTADHRSIILPLTAREQAVVTLDERTFHGKRNDVRFLTSYGKGFTGEIPLGVDAPELNAAVDPVDSARVLASRIVRAYGEGQDRPATAGEFSKRFMREVAPFPSVSSFDTGTSLIQAGIAHSRPAVNYGLSSGDFQRELATRAVTSGQILGLHVGEGEQGFNGQYRMTLPVGALFGQADLPSGWSFNGAQVGVVTKPGKSMQYEQGIGGQYKFIKDMKRELLRERLDVPGLFSVTDPHSGDPVRMAFARFALPHEAAGMGGTIGSTSFLAQQAVTQPRERRFSFSPEMPLSMFQPSDRTVFGANESITVGRIGDAPASIPVPGFYGSEIHGTPTLHLGWGGETIDQLEQLTGMPRTMLEAGFMHAPTTKRQMDIRQEAATKLGALPQFAGMDIRQEAIRGIELGVNVSHRMPAVGLKDATKLVPTYQPGQSEELTRQGIDFVVPYQDVKRPTFADQIGRGLSTLYESNQLLGAERDRQAMNLTPGQFAEWERNVYAPQIGRYNALPDATRQAAQAAHQALKAKGGTYFSAYQAAAPYLQHEGAVFPVAYDAGDVATYEYKGERSMTLPELSSLDRGVAEQIIQSSGTTHPKASILQSMLGIGKAVQGPFTLAAQQPVASLTQQLADYGIGENEAIMVGGVAIPGARAARDFQGNMQRLWVAAMTQEGGGAKQAAELLNQRVWDEFSSSENFRRELPKVQTQAGSFERYGMFMPGGPYNEDELVIGPQQADLYASQLGISREEFERAASHGEMLVSSKRYPINDPNASVFKLRYDDRHKGPISVSGLTALTEFGDADLDPRSVNVLGIGVKGKYQSIAGAAEMFARQPDMMSRAYASIASVIGDEGIASYQSGFKAQFGRLPNQMEMLTGIQYDNGSQYYPGIEVNIPGLGNQNLIGEMYADNFKYRGGGAISELTRRDQATVHGKRIAEAQLTTAQIKGRMSVYNLTQGLSSAMQRNREGLSALPVNPDVAPLMRGYSKADTASLSLRNLYQVALDAGNFGPGMTKLQQQWNYGYGFDSGQVGIRAQAASLASTALGEMVSSGVVAPESVAGVYATSPEEVEPIANYVSAYRANKGAGMHDPLTAMGMIYGGYDWDQNVVPKGINARTGIKEAPITQALEAKFAAQFQARQAKGTLSDRLTPENINALAAEAAQIKSTNPLYPEIQTQARRIGDFEQWIDAFQRGEITAEQFSALTGGAPVPQQQQRPRKGKGKGVARATETPEPDFGPQNFEDIVAAGDAEADPMGVFAGASAQPGDSTPRTQAGGAGGGSGTPTGGGAPPDDPWGDDWASFDKPNPDDDPWVQRVQRRGGKRVRQKGQVNAGSGVTSFGQLMSAIKTLNSSILTNNTMVSSMGDAFQKAARRMGGGGSVQEKLFGGRYREGAAVMESELAKLLDPQGRPTGTTFGETMEAEMESGDPQFRQMGDYEFSYMQKLDPYLKGTATATQMKDLYKATKRQLKRQDTTAGFQGMMTGVLEQLNVAGGPAAAGQVDEGSFTPYTKAVSNFGKALEDAKKTVEEFKQTTSETSKSMSDNRKALAQDLSRLYDARDALKGTRTELAQDTDTFKSPAVKAMRREAGGALAEISAQIRSRRQAAMDAGISEEDVMGIDRQARSTAGQRSSRNFAERAMSGYFAWQTLRAIRYTFDPVIQSGEREMAAQLSASGQLEAAGLGVPIMSQPGMRMTTMAQDLGTGLGQQSAAMLGGFGNLFGGNGGALGRSALGTAYTIGSPAVGAGLITSLALAQMGDMGAGHLGMGSKGLAGVAGKAGLVVGGLAAAVGLGAWISGASTDVQGTLRGAVAGGQPGLGDLTAQQAFMSAKWRSTKAPGILGELGLSQDPIADLLFGKPSETQAWAVENQGQIRAETTGAAPLAFGMQGPDQMQAVLASIGVGDSTLGKLRQKYGLSEEGTRQIASMVVGSGVQPTRADTLMSELTRGASMGEAPDQRLALAEQIAGAEGGTRVGAGADLLADRRMTLNAMKQYIGDYERGGGQQAALDMIWGGQAPDQMTASALTRLYGQQGTIIGFAGAQQAQGAASYRQLTGEVISPQMAGQYFQAAERYGIGAGNLQQMAMQRAQLMGIYSPKQGLDTILGAGMSPQLMQEENALLQMSGGQYMSFGMIQAGYASDMQSANAMQMFYARQGPAGMAALQGGVSMGQLYRQRFGTTIDQQARSSIERMARDTGVSAEQVMSAVEQRASLTGTTNVAGVAAQTMPDMNFAAFQQYNRELAAGGGWRSIEAAQQAGWTDNPALAEWWTQMAGSQGLAEGERWQQMTEFGKQYRRTVGQPLDLKASEQWRAALDQYGIQPGDIMNTAARYGRTRGIVSTRQAVQMYQAFTPDRLAEMDEETEFWQTGGGEYGEQLARWAGSPDPRQQVISQGIGGYAGTAAAQAGQRAAVTFRRMTGTEMRPETQLQYQEAFDKSGLQAEDVLSTAIRYGRFQGVYSPEAAINQFSRFEPTELARMDLAASQWETGGGDQAQRMAEWTGLDTATARERVRMAGMRGERGRDELTQSLGSALSYRRMTGSDIPAAFQGELDTAYSARGTTFQDVASSATRYGRTFGMFSSRDALKRYATTDEAEMARRDEETELYEAGGGADMQTELEELGADMFSARAQTVEIGRGGVSASRQARGRNAFRRYFRDRLGREMTPLEDMLAGGDAQAGIGVGERAQLAERLSELAGLTTQDSGQFMWSGSLAQMQQQAETQGRYGGAWGMQSLVQAGMTSAQVTQMAGQRFGGQQLGWMQGIGMQGMYNVNAMGMSPALLSSTPAGQQFGSALAQLNPMAVTAASMGGFGGSPMVDFSTGGGLFQRSMWGLDGASVPNWDQVSAFFNRGAQQLTGVMATPRSGTSIGFTPSNAWANIGGSSRDAIMNAATGNTFPGLGGIAGLQLLGQQWSMETNERMAGAAAGIAAKQAQLRRQFQLDVEYPQTQAGFSMRRAELWGGTVDDETKAYFEANGIPVPEYGRGRFARERAALAMQSQDLDANRNQTMTRLGWQLEDINREQARFGVQTAWQREDFALQGSRMQLQRGFQMYQFQQQREELSLNRQYFEEDFAFGKQTRGLQFSWRMEDLSEGIRRSSGQQRKSLIKQRERETEMYNLQEGQSDKEKGRQEERFKREEEYQKKALQHFQQMSKLEDKEFENAKKRFEEQTKWRDEDFNIRRGRIQQEMAWAEESFARQKASIELRLEAIAAEEADAKAQLAMQEVKFARQKELDEELYRLSQMRVGMTKEEKERQQALQLAIMTMRQQEQDRVDELNRTQMKFYTDLIALIKNIPSPSGLLDTQRDYKPVGIDNKPVPGTSGRVVPAERGSASGSASNIHVTLELDGKVVAEKTVKHMPAMVQRHDRRSYP